jgi:formylglycine-generating enzyme required for sulfatase activity
MKTIFHLLLSVILVNLACTILVSADTHDPANKAGDIWIEPVTGMEFVWVPGGCFMMGSTSGEACERPVHKVCLDGFWIGRYEVTQKQWMTVMKDNPAEFKKCGEDCPVETVSWYDCQAFIKKLGNRFSLPTEAQWEYAARSGGKDEIYSGGNDIDKVAWFSDNTKTRTHIVGTKAPNGLGIYDMSGNVWEWCRDWRGKYTSNAERNPKGPVSGSYRVIRGGACYSMPSWVRTTNRGRFYPEFSYLLTGFRLVRQ